MGRFGWDLLVLGRFDWGYLTLGRFDLLPASSACVHPHKMMSGKKILVQWCTPKGRATWGLVANLSNTCLHMISLAQQWRQRPGKRGPRKATRDPSQGIVGWQLGEEAWVVFELLSQWYMSWVLTPLKYPVHRLLISAKLIYAQWSNKKAFWG
jgi:hypothetical protein